VPSSSALGGTPAAITAAGTPGAAAGAGGSTPGSTGGTDKGIEAQSARSSGQETVGQKTLSCCSRRWWWWWWWWCCSRYSKYSSPAEPGDVGTKGAAGSGGSAKRQRQNSKQLQLTFSPQGAAGRRNTAKEAAAAAAAPASLAAGSGSGAAGARQAACTAADHAAAGSGTPLVFVGSGLSEIQKVAVKKLAGAVGEQVAVVVAAVVAAVLSVVVVVHCNRKLQHQLRHGLQQFDLCSCTAKVKRLLCLFNCCTFLGMRRQFLSGAPALATSVQPAHASQPLCPTTSWPLLQAVWLIHTDRVLHQQGDLTSLDLPD